MHKLMLFGLQPSLPSLQEDFVKILSNNLNQKYRLITDRCKLKKEKTSSLLKLSTKS